MTKVVREAINTLVDSTTEEINAATTDVMAMTLVANPVMHHLLLGINPVELGGAPFALATDEAVQCNASVFDFNTHPNAQVYVLPCIAGQRVRIDPETLEPKFSIIGSECWSDEPDFAEKTKELGVTGICGSGIIEVIAEMFLAGIINTDGVLTGTHASKSKRLIENDRTFSYLLHDGEVKIVITQNDVRQIQLAKAALYAGVRLLMDRLDIDQVDRIRLAGAFGSHIDVKYAMILGLIPDCTLANVSSAGNAAGSGARMALLNRNARGEIEQLVNQVEKIETAVEQKFQEHFVEAMGIPHKTAKFPMLSEQVTLPEPTAEASSGRSSRRRRRRS